MIDWKEKLKNAVKGKLLFNEPMAGHSTMRVGGRADVLFYPEDEEDLIAGIKIVSDSFVKYSILGKLSNTLVKDGGIRGLVIILDDKWSGYKIVEEEGEYVFVDVLAGTPTENFVSACIENGWSGFEGLAGIPGTIGGNVAMNAGTKHGVIGDVLEEVSGFDKTLNKRFVEKDKLELGYRKIKLPKGFIITSTLLKLKKGNKEEIAEKVTSYIEKRKQMQPWDAPSLGSVFKRPAKGYAGQLIEEAGLKGIRVGGARISEKHAGFILNENNATAKDVLVLIGLIKDRVKQNSDVNLETEIVVVGDDD